MKISIIHATARIGAFPSFPRGWEHAAESFFQNADHPEQIEYVLSIHESNWDRFCSMYPGVQTGPNLGWLASGIPFVEGFGRFLVVKNTGRNCVVDQCNAAAAVATGEIFMGSMDDLFAPKHWDTLIWEKMGIGQFDWPDEPAIARSRAAVLHVLHVRTGSPSDDLTFIPQILTKALYYCRGYMLHPSYESMFADNEFTETAKRDRLVIDGRHIVFEHRHPIFGTAESDSVYLGENREQAYRDGLANFEHRRALNFPLESESISVPKKPTIVVCCPGEIFHQEWVCGFANILLWLTHAGGFNLHQMFAYTSNVYCTRLEITDCVLGTNTKNGAEPAGKAFKPTPDLWLWLDDDNIVTREQLEQLIKDLAENPELHGVVGWCWCGRPDDPEKPFMMSCGRQDDKMRVKRFGAEDMEAANSPLVPIDWSGFPCVLLRHRVMETLGAGAFRPIVRPDVDFGFTSEDTAFFWHARQAGFRFAVDLRVKVPHVKYGKIEPHYVPRRKTEDDSALVESLKGLRNDVETT